MAADIPFSDYLTINNIIYEWAQSYDTKDSERLQAILAPSVRLDLSIYHKPVMESLTPAQFSAVMFDKKAIGDASLKTQHLMGVSQWKLLDDGTIEVWNQMRVAHQRSAADDATKVISKGSAHGSTQHIYKKVDGTWKLAAVKPWMNWAEPDFLATLKPEGA